MLWKKEMKNRITIDYLSDYSLWIALLPITWFKRTVFLSLVVTIFFIGTSVRLRKLFKEYTVWFLGLYPSDIDIGASQVAQMIKSLPAMQIPGFSPCIGKIP